MKCKGEGQSIAVIQYRHVSCDGSQCFDGMTLRSEKKAKKYFGAQLPFNYAM
jgi:hypothetical protein